MHIEKEKNDVSLTRDFEYGRIISEYEYNEDKGIYDPWDIWKTFTKCGYRNIKMRNKSTPTENIMSVKKSYNIECPYCPQTFVDLGNLNRHIWFMPPKTKSSCPYIPTLILWRDVWGDICEK